MLLPLSPLGASLDDYPKSPFLRTPYNYNRNAASDESAIHCTDPSLTRQSEAEDADINTIVRRFGLTGELPDNIRLPQYGDFTGIGSYHEALNAVAQAGEEFDKLPANIRARFNNDPEQFVAFCSDERNTDHLQEMGLLSDEAIERNESRKAALREPPSTPPSLKKEQPPKDA